MLRPSTRTTLRQVRTRTPDVATSPATQPAMASMPTMRVTTRTLSTPTMASWPAMMVTTRTLAMAATTTPAT